VVDGFQEGWRLCLPHTLSSSVSARLVHELADDGIDVAVSCRLLGASRSGYHEWKDRTMRWARVSRCASAQGRCLSAPPIPISCRGAQRFGLTSSISVARLGSAGETHDGQGR
jgi:hypothetical protein